MRENKILARLRQYEMRDIVRTYFAASLDRYVERLNATGLPDRSLDALRQEMRKARRDQIKAILSAAESLEGYSFRTRSDGAKAATGRSVSLSAAITDFKAEHGPQWSQEMRNKADAYLALLVEFFRPDKGMDQITRHPRRGGGSCN